MSQLGRVATSHKTTPRGLWWVSPAGAIAFVVMPTVLLAAYISDTAYRSSWGTPKYFTGAFTILLLQGAAIFMATSGIPLWRTNRKPESSPWPGLSTRTVDRLVTASNILFWMTMFGYIAFAAVGTLRGARPAMFLDVLISQNNLSGDLKTLFAPVSGVTTLTQVGVAYVVVAVVVLLHRKEPRLKGRIAILVALALVRAFFLTERLAILEVVIPVVVLLAVVWAGHPRYGVRAAIRWAPVVLVPAAIAIFAVFEYSRSWNFYQAKTGGSFVDFAIDRFAGYYATAYNNGSIALEHETIPGRLPLRTLEAIWDAPVLSQLNLYDRLSPMGNGNFQDLLVQYGNPEFNNPSGMFDPFVDYGHLGGLIWFAVAGLILGLIYRSFTGGATWAVLIYPILVTGLLELPRYLYWTQGRVLPAIVALLAVAWYATKRTTDQGEAPVEKEHSMTAPAIGDLSR